MGQHLRLAFCPCCYSWLCPFHCRSCCYELRTWRENEDGRVSSASMDAHARAHHAHTYMHIHARAHTHTHTHTSMHTHTLACTHMHTHTHNKQRTVARSKHWGRHPSRNRVKGWTGRCYKRNFAPPERLFAEGRKRVQVPHEGFGGSCTLTVVVSGVQLTKDG